ncbi:MAG: zinc ribbon domain-containing protein [Oscillospiraceae bacterium]|nr:zinc ribbon domain-containing protein [Oscillospiraceae bacterium]
MAKFCANCGSQVMEDKKFCKYCGAKIEDLPPPVPAAQMPPPIQQPQQQFQQPFAQQAPYAAAPVYAYSEKQKVLMDAPVALNNPGQPWEVTVEGDSIVARWKWMDATFFSPHEINEETKAFTFAATLNNNGKYSESDKNENKSAGVKTRSGKVGFGSSSSTFIGNSNRKSIQFGMGQNNQTGEVGFVGFKFDSTALKAPIREYLAACGWKKAGLFG